MSYNCSSEGFNMTLGVGADHPLHHRPSVSKSILSHFYPKHASVSLTCEVFGNLYINMLYLDYLVILGFT